MIFPINSQQKLQLAQQRVEILADRKDELLLSPDILGIVLEELAVTLEELQVQYEMLIDNQEKAEQERLHSKIYLNWLLNVILSPIVRALLKRPIKQ